MRNLSINPKEKLLETIADKVCLSINNLAEEVTEILANPMTSNMSPQKIENIHTEVAVIIDEVMVNMMRSINDFVKNKL